MAGDRVPNRFHDATPRLALWACALLIALAPFAPLATARAQQQPAKKATAKKPAPAKKAPTPAPPADQPVPFHIGEQLSFRVLWTKFNVNAATLNLAVVERRDFFGHSVWHFQGQGHTIDTTRLLYALDDQVDSYSDTRKLDAMQYELYVHEQGKQQNNAWHMSSSDSPPGESVTRVEPGTHDPLGALYALRSVDWKTTREFHSPVFDGVHQYEVSARANGEGQITVMAGTFKASRIDVDVAETGGRQTDVHFTLWLAQDAARTPVLIEAQAPPPIGLARVELSAPPQAPLAQ